MGLRYQKRIPLGKGLGVNLSGSGASVSMRTKYGSFGPRGFNLRTGIPGLTYRSGGTRSKGGGGFEVLVMLLFALTVGVIAVIAWNVTRFIFWAVVELVKALIRLFMKPREEAPSDAARYVHQLTTEGLPDHMRTATFLVTERLATDGTIVTQGMPVLRYTINGVPMTIAAHESGVLTHHKAPGDTILPDDALFTVRGERREDP
ncbi:MAG: DUF4236 domain-containing protein [Flavobacteriales bacterium]|nr:DUF4236 domain-containing protein [Flavobacteriales bacterium]